MIKVLPVLRNFEKHTCNFYQKSVNFQGTSGLRGELPVLNISSMNLYSNSCSQVQNRVFLE